MKSQTIYGISAVSLFLLFAFGIPTTTYFGAAGFLSFVGAFLIAACIVQAMANFDSFEQLTRKLEPEEQTQGRAASAFVFPVALIVLSLFLYMNLKGNVEKELKEFGVAGVAQIVDGKHTQKRSIRRTTS